MTDIVLAELRAADAEAAASVIADAIGPAGDALMAAGPVREHLVASLRRAPSADPGRGWIAWADDGAVGVATAIRRGSVWGLSRLFVRPGSQGRGVGRSLLDRLLGSADGASRAMIFSSPDPAAQRRYAMSGFDLVPAVGATGTADRAALPAGLRLREGSASDLDLVDDVDAALRGASRGPDVEFLLSRGARLLVADGRDRRGYAAHYPGQSLLEGTPLILGATGSRAARALLYGFLAESHGEVRFGGWTAAQQWAVEVALAARLTLTTSGPLFVRGGAPPVAWIGSGIHF